MAGTGLAKEIVGVVTRVIEWWIRVAVVSSLLGHVVLALFAGIRRREGPGVGMMFVWLAYQAVDKFATYFLSNLSLSDNTPREQQLVMEVWLPSIVAHLAGPDNITAYSLEDNKIFSRILLGAIFQVVQIFWLMFKQFAMVTIRGALFWASFVMTVVGVYKYLEKILAFWKADFSNIGSSSKKQVRLAALDIKQVLEKEPPLLLAHQLLDITKAAFADKFYLSTKERKQLKEDPNLQEIFFVDHPPDNILGWKNMCKVVEMELSLMYDILYTKAAVIHKWRGFVVRAVSPVVTGTVIVLFCLTGSTDDKRTADVIITYILLAVAFLLDVRWLLGAAASSWTYRFFSSTCLRHEVCCSGRWHWLRRFLESLDPLPLRMHSDGYRLWSGTIGQYNLFHECTRLDHPGTASRLLSSLAKIVNQEDALIESRYSSGLNLDESFNDDVTVRELLFEEIQRAFKMDIKPPDRMAPPPPKAALPLEEEEMLYVLPKVEAHKARRDLDEELDFLPEFQELILIWHVATDVFISSSHGQFTREDHRRYVEVIKAVSNYMAFLAAVRPDMLPGLKLRSLHEATFEALECLSGKARGERVSRQSLIRKLNEKEQECGQSTWIYNGETKKRSALYDQSPVLSDGVKFGNLLSQKLDWMLSHEAWEKNLQGDDQTEGSKSNSRKRFEFLIPDLELESNEGPLLVPRLLRLLLKSWVRLLIYVSIRCSRDSHAKQLGRGGELTTIVWILSEHAGIFAHWQRDGRY